jgi:adenylate cyclase
VNVASRVTALARPGTLLVTDPARHSCGSTVDLIWVPVGAQRLHGVPAQVELFRVHRASS